MNQESGMELLRAVVESAKEISLLVVPFRRRFVIQGGQRTGATWLLPSSHRDITPTVTGRTVLRPAVVIIRIHHRVRLSSQGIHLRVKRWSIQARHRNRTTGQVHHRRHHRWNAQLPFQRLLEKRTARRRQLPQRRASATARNPSASSFTANALLLKSFARVATVMIAVILQRLVPLETRPSRRLEPRIQMHSNLAFLPSLPSKELLRKVVTTWVASARSPSV